MVSGNHEDRSKRTTDTDLVEDICDYLEISHLYRPIESFVKITFGKQLSGNKQMYGIYLTHGSGNGGKRPGSNMNNLEMLALSVEADIFVCGHGHKRMAYKNQYRKVDLYHENITERERLFVMSSHWSSYFGGYAASKMFTPSAKGSVPITLYAKTKHFEAVI